MSLITQLQKLEPGAEIMLFELDGSEYGADILRFHGHAIPHTPEELAAAGADADQLPAKSIWWQGNEYGAWPMQIEGVEANSDGTAVRPTISVGNVNGRITALCLAFADLLEFKLTIRHTLGQYRMRPTSQAATLRPTRTKKASRSGTSTRRSPKTAPRCRGSWPAPAMWVANRSAANDPAVPLGHDRRIPRAELRIHRPVL